MHRLDDTVENALVEAIDERKTRVLLLMDMDMVECMIQYGKCKSQTLRKSVVTFLETMASHFTNPASRYHYFEYAL